MPRGERPLDVGDSPLLRFAADLRSLRDKAGGHSYRQLGARAHYSATTLSDAAGGRKLPSLAVTLAYVRACEGDVAEWEDRWHRVAAEVLPSPEPAPEEAHPPYAGLAAFRVEDAEWFFGRDRFLEDLLSKVRARRFVAVFGASGAGKSSLLRAGLVPRFEGTAVVTTPSALGVDPDALDQAADLVIVDQFEEVFTLCPDAGRRAAFVEALLAAPFRVVLGVRADFYGHCGQHPALVDALADGQLLLGPMGPEELRQAIMRPAVKASCTVETALVSRLVADATGQAGVLPLLSHALLETWRRRRGTTLTLAGYEAAGGVQHAIAQTAERTYTSLEKQQRVLARQVFLRLTALGDGTEDTKRRLPRGELDADVDVDVVLDRLAHARLLTLDRDGVEIAHEALIRSWPRLRGWLAEDRDGLRTMRQLSEAAATWESLGRDPDALYRGTRLDTAVEWTQRSGARTSTRERDFLDASLAARDRERALAHRRTRRLRQLVALLLALLVLAAGATTLAVRSQRAVVEQRNSSVARYVAYEAQSKLGTDQNLANQLFLAAHRLSGTEDLRDGVLSAHAAMSRDVISREQRSPGQSNPDGTRLPTARVPEVPDDTTYRALGRLTSPANSVTSFVATPSNEAFATTAEAHRGRVWDLTEARSPVVAHTFPDPVSHLVLAPTDGRLLVTADGVEVTLWDTSDLRSPRPLAALPDHGGRVARLEFSSDGRTLVTVDAHGAVRLWDVTDPRVPKQLGLLPDGGDVRAAALSADRRTLAVGGPGGAIRLWDTTNGWAPKRLAQLDGHRENVLALGFRADGTALASAGRDGTVRLWDLADRPAPRAVAKISGRTEGVLSVSFGTRSQVVTLRNDGTTRLWEFDFDLAAGQMCAAAARSPISRDDWRFYFGDVEYQPPCG
ncbi:nSTAND1 domain-containing NTPase [Saccharothrix coeruleofusca]|uniref:HTH cro/C1-type domain-containing protein n=1 Tax=Saccharothrix coeruleofusca TaxID=33919 RepID=A0A918ASZ7_9PSEU|nr:XRE family transcriptional regulator [Saccharothrix coeruleofusca]GGP71857.1 hypothetical protein GCM10010185_51440 [Saccharothrix coeruleofusca]